MSVDALKLTSGIGENIHRYLDEAPRENLTYRMHSFGVSSERRWEPSRPEGVPSPLLTAERGLREEISKEAYRLVADDHHRFIFLNLIFELNQFHPYLVGIVDLGMTRDELSYLIQNLPAEDHPEYEKIEYFRLNVKDKQTLEHLMAPSQWVPAGMSAFITALRYWEACERI